MYLSSASALIFLPEYRKLDGFKEMYVGISVDMAKWQEMLRGYHLECDSCVNVI